jgi:uncharacterized protein (DUF58 family)
MPAAATEIRSVGAPPRERAKYRPTNSGWTLLALATVALVVPRPFRDGPDPRPFVGAAILLALILETLFLLFQRDRAQARVELPRTLRVDEEGNIVVHADFRPGLKVRYATTFTLDERSQVRIPVVAKQRGVFRARSVFLDEVGPLGILQRSSPIPVEDNLVCVGPKRVSIPLPPPLLSPAPSSDQDVDRLRAYQPGDDVRLLHWRSMARTNEPTVQVRNGVRPVTKVAIDLGPTDGPKAERWASYAAHVLSELIKAGPIEVRSRDSYGETVRHIFSDRHIDIVLGSAETGESVQISHADLYIGSWRPDLESHRGLQVLSDHQAILVAESTLESTLL